MAESGRPAMALVGALPLLLFLLVGKGHGFWLRVGGAIGAACCFRRHRGHALARRLQMSWFLFALCGFATCCEVASRAPEQAPA